MWARMINSPMAIVKQDDWFFHATVGHDDSYLCRQMISSPLKVSYLCSLGLTGSTSHVINE